MLEAFETTGCLTMDRNDQHKGLDTLNVTISLIMYTEQNFSHLLSDDEVNKTDPENAQKPL